MHDLAERMTWAVTPNYAGANHYPAIALKTSRLSGRPGDVVSLSAATSDPDGDRVSVKWWGFENNGTYAGAVALETTEGPTTISAFLRTPGRATRSTSSPRRVTPARCR